MMSRKRHLYDDFAASKVDPPEMDHLFSLIENGRLDYFKFYHHSINLEDVNESGDTYLHATLSNCNRKLAPGFLQQLLQMMFILMTKAPKLTKAKNQAGETPLCYACRIFAQFEVIQYLIYFDSETVTIPDSLGYTPLYHLAGPKFYKLHRDIMKGIESKFGLKCIEHCLQLSQMLIDQGAYINAENEEGINILQHTIDSQKKTRDPFLPMIELLIDYDGSLASTRGTHALKFTKSLSMTKVILNIDNREVNILDKDGMTPLHHIIEGSRGMKDDIIIYLLEKGVILENGTDAIELAQKANCSFPVIDLLLKLNPNYDVNTRFNNDVDENTTLLILYGKNIDIIERLLYLGADASLETNDSMNAIFTALNADDDKAIIKLLEAGANPLVYDKSGISCVIQICMKAEKDKNGRKWLDLIQFFIQHCKSLDLIPSKPVSEMYIEIFLCLYIAYNSNNKDRILKILQAFLETDNSFLSELMICAIPNTTYYIFKENSYENISNLLATISSRSEEFPNKMKEFIYILFDVGFTVCNTPEYCITALTTLLAFKNDGSELLGDVAQYCLVEEFIMRGVNVESIVLQIRDVRLDDSQQQLWNFHSTEISRYMLYLPDSVFLAFLNKRLNALELLLPHWWGPPLALFTFTSSAKSEDVIFWFKFLFKYGSVPHGTHLFRKLKIYLGYLNSVAKDDENKDEEIVSFYQQFLEVHKSPLSLRELAKYAVRKSFAKRSLKSDTSLPTLLRQNVPQTLHFLAVHQVPMLPMWIHNL